jgi:hypothetical protein
MVSFFVPYLQSNLNICGHKVGHFEEMVNELTVVLVNCSYKFIMITHKIILSLNFPLISWTVLYLSFSYDWINMTYFLCSAILKMNTTLATTLNQRNKNLTLTEGKKLLNKTLEIMC